jgi:hypothetical protein
MATQIVHHETPARSKPSDTNGQDSGKHNGHCQILF